MTVQSLGRISSVCALVGLVTGSSTPAYGADAAVSRVLMLPLVDRTTVVAELTQRVARVQEIASSPAMVMIEAGPVDAATRPLDLTPVVRSPFVAGLSLRTTLGPDGLTYLRMRITLGAFCTHRLRVAGSRVYVDLVPVEERSPSPLAPVPPPAKAPSGRVSPQAPRPAESSPADTVDAAYQALESSGLRRARELAGRPDVTALLRLHDEILTRDDRLGRRRPEVVERLLAEVLRYTNEARVAQLKKDREALLKAP
jgi:hypothetical protein